MNTRKLGNSGIDISPIAIGTREVGEKSKQQTIETLQYAIDSGINFINTADFYGMGMNELIIGEAIKNRREKAFISVKTGALRNYQGHFLGFDGRPNAIKNFCAYSLTRLGVNEIDLYQIARIDPNVPIEESVGAIKDLIQEGKVRCLGLSEVNADQIRRANAVHPVTAVEIEYSLATRFIEKEILPEVRKIGASLIPYSVLSYGLLTGNLSGPLPKEDYKNMFPRFQGENLQYNLKLVEKLQDIASQKGITAGDLALAWALHQGDDIIPIVGMSSTKRVDKNINLVESIQLTSEENKLLNETFGIGVFKGERYPDALLKVVAS
ncbi:Predicted oxidoreductase [Flavobacterium aquidurense]|uniref:Aldo/keto reductase n=1 Tax=Flavobacterium frigidimaris TaxID=262320 RepID=A0ABX4BNF4_FLAFR|nr:aldo/keto reductase [Flavobacterium frigidimaris]OXA77409.1 aldo/keto reductase [Flavobacterium frigidimaris]SDZ62627.1 Predicted oxidoreductase [Flavobacterium aquidurense]